MKNNPPAFTKALDIMINDTALRLQDRIIYTEDDGSYNVFGKYIIKKNNTSHNISFRVSNISGNLIHDFYTIKNALTWCIFDYRNKFYDSRRIIDLDRQLSSVDANIMIHKRLYKRSKKDNKEIFELKLHEDLLTRNSIVSTLKGYITAGNAWQINRLNTNV